MEGNSHYPKVVTVILLNRNLLFDVIVCHINSAMLMGMQAAGELTSTVAYLNCVYVSILGCWLIDTFPLIFLYKKCRDTSSYQIYINLNVCLT